jgi:transglutaminase-like putative cysteine protease
LTTRPVFRTVWWASNALLILALVATVWSGVWEYSTRQYLRGFSDAIVPQAASPQQKVEAILEWMKKGPPRQEARNLNELSPRDPQNTLNYRQLLQVCGGATNAFLNLARSSGLDSRRLLLLTPERTTDHVVAEILLDGRWVIVDPTYRVMLKDAQGNLLTSKDLQNPGIFQQATSGIPNYPPEYNYARFAHVRLAALPFQGAQLRRFLDYLLPGWDEYLDWGLLLERRSFFCLFLSGNWLIAMMLVRMILGWVADHRLQIPRFHLRTNLTRATAALFSTPEIK